MQHPDGRTTVIPNHPGEEVDRGLLNRILKKDLEMEKRRIFKVRLTTTTKQIQNSTIMPIKIDYKKCCWKDGKCTSCTCSGACSGCVEACPVGALKREKLVILDKAKCISCQACVFACKHKAISMQ